jgi:hypothetical protein
MASLSRIRFRIRVLRAAARWAARDLLAGWRMKPIAGAAPPDPDPDPKPEPDPKPDPKPDPDPDPKPDPDPDPVNPDDDWKAKSRKNETRAKKAEREAKEAKEALAKREEADQTESEKAVAKAKEEGRKEALTEAEKERRADRLEVAVTRLASKGIKIGEGDEAKMVRFADSEDALLHVERAISRGEVDAADIYDDEGKVKADALTAELAQLLERKPHLAAGKGETPKPGDPDFRKGDPAKNDLEAMSPEDHAKRKYPASK